MDTHTRDYFIRYDQLLGFLTTFKGGILHKDLALKRSQGYYMISIPKSNCGRNFFGSPFAFKFVPIVQGSSVMGNVWKLEVRNDFNKPENIFMYKEHIEQHMFFYLI